MRGSFWCIVNTDSGKSLKVFTINQNHCSPSIRIGVHDQSESLFTFGQNMQPCLVGMEACGSAHYWAKVFTGMGHTVKLLPPAYVKGFLYGNKNDANDAKAIALASVQVESPSVAIKSAQQLALQAVARVRERRVKQRTECTNQLRGLLYEHGVILAKGHARIRSIDMDTIPESLHDTVSDLVIEFKEIDKRVRDSDKQVSRIAYQHPLGEALLEISGFGVMNVFLGLIINPDDFRNGRHYAAYLGCVPKQTGSGGKTTLQGISKRGNRYHRQVLFHGARAFLTRSKDQNNPLLLWARRIQDKKGVNVAVAALANKLARISWHVLKGERFDVNKAVMPLND